MGRTSALLVGLLLLPVAACAEDTDDDRTLTVLAASSLTEVFEGMAKDFESAHPGVDVRLSFGSSTTLAQQAADGAPGDVLATADRASMAIAEAAGVLDGHPEHLASNEMVLVVPRRNPAGIRSVADLPGSDWVRCADDVPCGRVASALVEASDVADDPASLEVDVKSVLAKVTAGEADAGLVYETDALEAGDRVEVIEVPHAAEHPADYYIAVLADTRSGFLAAEFVELVHSPAGVRALFEAGFGTRISR